MAGTATLKLYSFSSISSGSSLFPCYSFSFKPYVLPMRVFPGMFSTTRFIGIYALSSNDIKVVLTLKSTVLLGVYWIDEADLFEETSSQFVFMDLVIDLELPITVKLTVVDVDPGLKGGSKPATLDIGAVVNVPALYNAGDEILVDTRTGQ